MMTASRVSKERKMALLNVIQEKRSILFGKISEVDNKQRHLGWMEVLSSAQSLQIVSAERDFAFVRDKIWGVWKSRAMSKRENMTRKGKGGGREKPLNEVDTLILDILEGDLPIKIEEVHGSADSVVDEADINGEDENATEVEVVESIPSRRPGRSALFRTNTKRKGPRVEKFGCNFRGEHTKRKNLELTLLELQIHKDRLECLRLERELKLPPSEYTSPLF